MSTPSHSGFYGFPQASQGGPVIHEAGTFGELLRAWAIWYTQVLRWPVFPCVAGRKEPVTRHGFKSARLSEEFVRQTWDGRRMYNIAIPTGLGTADVLDVEGVRKPGGDGWAAYHQLREAGMLAGARMLTGTPSEGAHLFFKGTVQPCGSLRKSHIEVKAFGGYVLVPPSQVGGIRYRLIDIRPPTGAVLDWQAAKNLLRPPKPVPARRVSRRGSGSARGLVNWLEGEFEGNRNNGLFWAACRALEAGDEDVADELAEVALSAGLGEEEVRRTIASAYKAVAS